MYKFKKPNTQLVIHAKDLDEGTMEQITNISLHPAFKNLISIMPDCLTEDTEVLTINGFVPISSLVGNESVANVYPVTNEIKFVPIKQIINRNKRECEKIYNVHFDALDRDITLSENHRIPMSNGTTVIAKDLVHGGVINDFYLAGGTYDGVGVLEIDDTLKLIAWIIGDGNIKKSPNKNETGRYIRFGLKKQRKIDRIILLLNRLNVAHSVNVDKRGLYFS